jgi:DNA-binding Lrp family transcriptional regulator
MVGNLTKSSKETILRDEIKVMDALEQNSKESVDQIAKRCGLSRQKVWRIIKDLEKRKVIWGYTAETDEIAKHLKHFTLLVKRSTLPFNDDIRKEVMFDKLDNRLPGLVKIENIYATHGMADFIFTFYAPNIITAKKFVGLLFSKHTNYIQDYFLLETLFPIRKNGIKNPQMKNLSEYL